MTKAKTKDRELFEGRLRCTVQHLLEEEFMIGRFLFKLREARVWHCGQTPASDWESYLSHVAETILFMPVERAKELMRFSGTARSLTGYEQSPLAEHYDSQDQ